jgi:hypothetical protein
MAVELDARSLVADGVARVFLLAEPAGAPAGAAHTEAAGCDVPEKAGVRPQNPQALGAW